MSQEQQGFTLGGMIGAAAAGAVAAVIAAFSFGLVTLTSTANTMASDAANNARTEILTPICFAEAMGDPEFSVKLANLKDANWRERDNVFKEAGWAQLTGDIEMDMDSDAADNCIDLLRDYEPAAAEAAAKT